MDRNESGLGPRTGYLAGTADLELNPELQPQRLLPALEAINLAQRTVLAIMFNCVPSSGHPGGSISASRLVEGLLYRGLDYDISDHGRADADLISFAAGHKAMGLYAAWALRNEVVRITQPQLLPQKADQLRLEDLLGFRKNPSHDGSLFKKLKARALDGHPTPATPFVKLATGASGVGVGSSFGLAFAAMDLYPDDPPQVHVIEGEGGLTPGRVSEAMALAASANLHNIVLHVDWNQSSIDSDRVCRTGEQAGDYVQWDPVELARLHDFNALLVEDGLDHHQVLDAQAWAREHSNDQPSAIIYKTVKGWRYGIEGRAAHGAGHGCCSPSFYESLSEFEERWSVNFPRLSTPAAPAALEEHLWDLLSLVRQQLEQQADLLKPLGRALVRSRERLAARKRTERPQAPQAQRLFAGQELKPQEIPEELISPPGARTTLRDSLARALDLLNRHSSGGLIVSSADLAGSTSIAQAAQGFDQGFYNARSNPGSRLVACGGICEDAMGAFLSALGASGRHVGVGSSYGAFMAAMQHVPARLHAIGQEARRNTFGIERSPYLMVCAHAGLKTGEDGPTHADPQCLQILQENFPPDGLITLTPWDPNEIWPCLMAGLLARPAVLAPFVTRPSEEIIDRAALKLPPVEQASQGLYALRTGDPAKTPYHGALVLQGSSVAYAFLEQALGEIDGSGLNMDVLYLTSTELFDRLPRAQQDLIWGEERARWAMGITGFTMATMYRWVTSAAGRKASLHPFRNGHFPGSGQADQVLSEAGLDGKSQWLAIRAWAEYVEETKGGHK